jgi:F-type H+-transporting ATPase subunit a
MSKLAIGLLLVFVIVIDVIAFIFVPPFDKADPEGACEFPVCYIEGNLKLPAPYVLVGETQTEIIAFIPSITSTMVTMWIISAFLIVGLWALSRRRDPVPGRLQNFMETIYEGLEGFAKSLGGEAATKYVPLFVGLFLYIVVSNWSGIVPPVNKIDQLRAPTSDLNITLGLALVAFVYFHVEGVRALGVGGYLGKFFPLGEFRNGVGAGVIAMFVGLVELLLEFVKPLTLSMRLFGNIYGGSVALGVMTALTIGIIPIAVMALELMLATVQAVIFATLTVMFTLAAIEGHHSDEEHHEAAEHASEPTATPAHPDAVTAGAH